MPRTHFSAPRFSDAADLPTQAHRLLPRLRDTEPLVQCLTNPVTVNFVANGLLALGATPAMTDTPGEAGPFAGVASAMLINLGTPHAEQREAMLEAATAARDADAPWVLDPVAVGALPVRTALAHRLLDLSPTVIRGNASEIRALAGDGTGGRGVDSSDTPEAALPAALRLAETTGAVVAISGETDLITDGESIVRIANGHQLLTRVTGAGCLLGAVVAAFASTDADQLATTVVACTVFTVAAELAAEQTERPGSFAVAFPDALDEITADDVVNRAQVTVEPAPAHTTPQPDLSVYLVTDSDQTTRAGRTLVETVAAAVAGGVTTVQLREKHTPAQHQVELLQALSEVLPPHVTLLINDRVDVYLAARHRGARVHGVHVGQSDLDVEEVRRLIGPDPVIGLSAATPDQLAAAETSSANVAYVGIGALRTTTSKSDAPAPIGTEAIAQLAATATLPAVAIGGVVPEDLPGLRDAGFTGAAVVSWICATADPQRAAAELAGAWGGAA